MKEDYTITEQLLNDLEKMSAANMLPLEQRLCDTAIWFHRNKDRVPREDLAKRLDFMEKTLEIFIELAALLVDRTQRLEGKGRDTPLWLPSNINVSGSLRG